VAVGDACEEAQSSAKEGAILHCVRRAHVSHVELFFGDKRLSSYRSMRFRCYQFTQMHAEDQL